MKAPAPVTTNPPAGDLLGGLGATIGGLDDLLGDLSVGGGICAPASPPSGPAMTGGVSRARRASGADVSVQMQRDQGMGVPGMGATGMGVPGMGATGMGATGMGMLGMGVPGMGVPGMGMPGIGMPGMGASQMGMPGMGASQMGPGIGFAASPPSSPKMGTLASAGKAPSSPNAIGGGASAYTQRKDSKAFDFVQDMLSGKK